MVQLVDASLKERQYNLANQLTKSLQARVMGKKLPRTDHNLLLTFANHFRGTSPTRCHILFTARVNIISVVSGELSEDGVEQAVLQRLYSLGCEVMSDGVSLPIEATVLHGSWSLYKHFKVFCSYFLRYFRSRRRKACSP